MKNPSPLQTVTPRYLVVAQALIRDIETGRFKVGEMLPPELDICTRFGVSRFTAREAIRRLTDAGLVTRRAGIGTTVRASSAKSRYTASISDPTELYAFTTQTRLEVLSEDWVEIAGELEVILPDAIGQKWLRISTLRYVPESEEPIAYTEILVHPAYEAIRDRIKEKGATVYRLIEDLHGERVVELKQEISATVTPKKIATLLGTRAGTPALRVLRYYLGARNTLMSLAINTYPHDRFKLTTRWRLDWSPETPQEP
ncbi:GntR family transcriptional regulator [soil metagenome]